MENENTRVTNGTGTADVPTKLEDRMDVDVPENGTSHTDIKPDPGSESDASSDVPLTRRRSTSNKKRAIPADSDVDEQDQSDDEADDEGDDDYDHATSKGKPSKAAPRSKSPAANPTTSAKRRKDDDSSAVDSSEEDIPLAQRQKAVNGKQNGGTRKAANGAAKKATPKAKPKPKPKKKARVASSDEEEDASASASDAEDSPASTRAPVKRKRTTKQKASDSGSSSDIPLASVKKQKKGPAASDKKGKTPVKDELGVDPSSSASPKKSRKKKEEDEDEDQFKWWEQENATGDGSVKWTTLEHNGVLFPPPYEPHGVKMLYDGKEVELEPDAEEPATWYAAVVGSVWDENPRFRENFFRDWKELLNNQAKPCPIKVLDKCNFGPITEHLNKLKEQRQNRSKEEKQKEKDAKAEIEKQYGFALLDGRKEKIGNFRIEPPGLFRGRGEHPKTGSIKPRITAENVTLNLGEDAPVPPAPPGQKWAKVVHDNTKTWLASWKDFVNDHPKYVFLSATSSLKGQSDLKKFEKARELKKHIKRIRRDYEEELKDKHMDIRQRATAMYLIDRLALRAGNEKGEDEADTVGCCSIRYEHITLEPPRKIIFDFLGKDSIRYYNEVEVTDQVFKNLKIFKRDPKGEGDPVFDRLDTASLNKHLQTYQKGLTAKVFRTYNASWTFQQELEKTPEDGTAAEKVLAYNRANREVAILCNHQRTVSKGHGGQMTKLQDKACAKILRIMYFDDEATPSKQLILFVILEEILELDPKLKKKRPELEEEESDVDEEFVTRHLVAVEEKALEAARKKFKKENEKRAANGEEELSESEMPDVDVERRPIGSLDKLEKAYEKISERIRIQKLNAIDKDENKTTATGTSKINYIDPRISIAWCKKYDVPLEKIFNKTLRDKFKWASGVDAEWSSSGYVATTFQQRTNMSIRLGLERIFALLEALGDPHKQYDIVHVTGTNGKGSVTALVANILKSSGRRVGRFNSPHLISPNDAIRIDESIISKPIYDLTRQRVEQVNASAHIDASSFEVTTALAFVIFADAKVDMAVIEVGMGGRLDATNVHPSPLVCVVTSVAMDHVEFLGDTIVKIATEKAGIFKKHCRVVIGPQAYDDARETLEGKAKELKCECLVVKPATREGQIVKVMFRGGLLDVELPLMGGFQLENVATAVASIEQLPYVTKEHVVDGIRHVRWPGRLELVDINTDKGQTRILVDGAHNEAAAKQLRVAITEQLENKSSKKVGWIFGMSRGKNVSAILDILVRDGDVVCATEFGVVEDMPWIKCIASGDIIDAAVGLSVHVDTMTAARVKDAIDGVMNRNDIDLIVLCGSLYLVGDLYRTFELPL
ncbi:tetrahydrofolate synthase [Synchytrium microbalum]|uniref:DNA topoisomerase I n=1 Tax=Synchytrium microbalum TaxID=1806994 RepID=A0A507BUW1_9FUNG|nr:tetrahydrofolate synthase [Synchytrium microbalum]TPX31058.1 tetrahydrofolate synthase [Synchytrium microbalum]